MMVTGLGVSKRHDVLSLFYFNKRAEHVGTGPLRMLHNRRAVDGVLTGGRAGERAGGGCVSYWSDCFKTDSGRHCSEFLIDRTGRFNRRRVRIRNERARTNAHGARYVVTLAWDPGTRGRV